MWDDCIGHESLKLVLVLEEETGDSHELLCLIDGKPTMASVGDFYQLLC